MDMCRRVCPIIPGFFPLGKVIRSDVDFDFRDVDRVHWRCKEHLSFAFFSAVFLDYSVLTHCFLCSKIRVRTGIGMGVWSVKPLLLTRELPDYPREKILYSAMHLFVSKGYKETSILDVVDWPESPKPLFIISSEARMNCWPICLTNWRMNFSGKWKRRSMLKGKWLTRDMPDPSVYGIVQ